MEVISYTGDLGDLSGNPGDTMGLADLHNHQFANLGFGGVEFFSDPAGPISTALPWCTPSVLLIGRARC